MEIIKSIVKQFYPLLTMMACVFFAIYTFFSANLNNGQGMLEAGGNLYAPMLETDELINDGFSFVGDSSREEVPVITYISGVQKVGTNFIFKSLLNVIKTDGTVVNGTTEDGFALYLIDIQTKEGKSVLQTLSATDIENLEEIPSAFIYDKAADRLYLYSSGLYTVYVKIYSESGGQETYEFKLPVESM